MSYIMQFLIIIGLALIGNVKVIIQSSFSRHNVSRSVDGIAYNAVAFIFTALTMAVLFGIKTPDAATLIYGIVTGVLAVTFQITYTLAIACGPVSLTVLITSMSNIAVVLFSLFYYNEKMYVTHILGLALILVAMFLINGKDKNGTKPSGKWLFLSLTALLANSISANLQRYFTRVVHPGDGALATTYSTVIFATGGIIALVIVIICGKTPANRDFKFNKFYLLYGSAAGIVLGVYQRLYMVGCAEIDGVFMSPCLSGMNAIIATAVGVLLFKDKLTKRQLIGVLCGISCVVLMNLRVVAL